MESSPQIGYVPILDPESTSSGSEGDYEGSDSDISQELVTSNVGVMYQYQGQEERLLDERKAQEHIEFRNKYFTPEITRHNVYCKITATTTTIDLNKYGFDIDRVIVFKLIKGYLGIAALNLVTITIPEIPYIACKKNEDCKHIIDIVSIYSGSNPQYFENKNLIRDIFFPPIKLSTLTITIDPDNDGSKDFLEFEITTLNRYF